MDVRMTGRRREGRGGFEETARRRTKAKEEEQKAKKEEMFVVLCLVHVTDELGRTNFSLSRLLPVILTGRY
jgi:hypothetical protein